ncbi:MAG: hypothetical protein A2Z96_01440 [Spirochaetes bacterium GWB1_48_6]|nr:MAG: hypothetical protein A2Z96_01440 [Spirochaetes bacterium GWB1_48_6]
MEGPEVDGFDFFLGCGSGSLAMILKGGQKAFVVTLEGVSPLHFSDGASQRPKKIIHVFGMKPCGFKIYG